MKPALWLTTLMVGCWLTGPVGAEQPAGWIKDACLPDVEGEEYALRKAADAGKSLVLIFWAPWCGSCKKEAPALVAAAEQWKARAEFVGVVAGKDALVPERKVRSFMEAQHLSYPTLRDRNLKVTEGLQVKGTPTIIVISPDMKIAYRGHRPPEQWTSVL